MAKGNKKKHLKVVKQAVEPAVGQPTQVRYVAIDNPTYSPEDTILTESVGSDIIRERIRQVSIWGMQRREPGAWLSILGEEFGEVCEAMQKVLGLESGKETDAADLYKELSHVAAVAIAWGEQILQECMIKLKVDMAAKEETSNTSPAE